MNIVRSTLNLLLKIFAADIWLTLTALASVGLCAAGLRFGLLSPGALPFVLTLGIAAALTVGVARGSKR